MFEYTQRKVAIVFGYGRVARLHHANSAPRGSRWFLWTGLLALLAQAMLGCTDEPAPSSPGHFSSAASASAAPSAVRLPDESFEEARQRSEEGRQRKEFFAATSVINSARPLADLDTTQVTTWTGSEVVRGFRAARDERRFHWSSQPSFARRPSFLYPDDGCFVRAKLMDETLAAGGYLAPTNVWLFGDLEVATPNHPDGKVRWWFHVAPIVKANGQIWVIDPSIHPAAPLALTDWIAAQADPEWVDVAICDMNVYAPDDPCHGATSPWRPDQRDQDSFFTKEWDRQDELRHDPSQVLGDAPPWL